MIKKLLASVVFFGVLSASVVAQDIARIKITDLESKIAEAKGPLVINFWATFCKPCVEEIPHFVKLSEKYRDQGLQMLFVSLDLEEDYPAKVQMVAQKLGIKNRVVWLDEFDADYFIPKIDSSWSGALPATLLLNTQKGYRRFLDQVLTEEKLKLEIDQMLDTGRP